MKNIVRSEPIIGDKCNQPYGEWFCKYVAYDMNRDMNVCIRFVVNGIRTGLSDTGTNKYPELHRCKECLKRNSAAHKEHWEDHRG